MSHVIVACILQSCSHRKRWYAFILFYLESSHRIASLQSCMCRLQGLSCFCEPLLLVCNARCPIHVLTSSKRVSAPKERPPSSCTGAQCARAWSSSTGNIQKGKATAGLLLHFISVLPA